MTFAVRYYTKTGNTKRLAEAVAKELENAAAFARQFKESEE